jgi:hypothetical protein
VKVGYNVVAMSIGKRRKTWIAWVLLALPARALGDPLEFPVGRTPADPTTPPVHVEGPFWQDGIGSRWMLEGTIASGAWLSSDLSTGARQQLDIGGVGAVGFRYVRGWRHRTPISGLGEWSLAAMYLSVGLIALPADSWLGNERGLDLRVRGSASPRASAEPWGVSFGIAPVFRISPNGSRLRFTSIVGALLPEFGVTVGEQHPSAYFVWSPFPIGVVFVHRFALELNIEQGLSVPFDGTAVRSFIGARLGLVVR